MASPFVISEDVVERLRIILIRWMSIAIGEFDMRIPIRVEPTDNARLDARAGAVNSSPPFPADELYKTDPDFRDWQELIAENRRLEDEAGNQHVNGEHQ